MRDKLSVIIITVVIFVGGLVTGIWTQKVRPSPPPRIPFFGELIGGRFQPPTPEEIEQMDKKMENLRPQMEAYRKKMSAMENDFREKIRNVLREEQRPRWDALVEKQKEMDNMFLSMGREGNGSRRRHDGFPGSFREPMLLDFMGIIIYKPMLEKLSKELSLDSGQIPRIEEIIREYRQKIIQFVDENPPPSLSIKAEHERHD